MATDETEIKTPEPLTPNEEKKEEEKKTEENPDLVHRRASAERIELLEKKVDQLLGLDSLEGGEEDPPSVVEESDSWPDKIKKRLFFGK